MDQNHYRYSWESHYLYYEVRKIAALSDTLNGNVFSGSGGDKRGDSQLTIRVPAENFLRAFMFEYSRRKYFRW